MKKKLTRNKLQWLEIRGHRCKKPGLCVKKGQAGSGKATVFSNNGLLPVQTQHKMGYSGRQVTDPASAVRGEGEHHGREHLNELITSTIKSSGQLDALRWSGPRACRHRFEFSCLQLDFV